MKKNWHELISQPKYEIKAKKNIYVTARDGTKLAVNVLGPDAQGMRYAFWR